MAKKLFAVTYISFFDNEIGTAFVAQESSDEMQALRTGVAKILKKDASRQDIEEMFAGCETLDEAKTQAFDTDSMVHVERFVRSQALDS